MFTTRFAASSTDLPRRERTPTNSNAKRRSRLSLSLSLFPSPFPSPPARELGTEREKVEDRERPRGHNNSSHSHRHSVKPSIHASPPVVSDRESSLYPHRVYASPTYDWSKSCNDLGVVSSLAASSTLDFHPFGIIGNTGDNGVGTGTESFYGYNDQTQSVACLGVYTPLHHQYHHSSIALPTSQASTRSPLYTPQRGYRDRQYQSTLELNAAANGYGETTGTDLEPSQRSSFTDHSYYLSPLNDVDAGAHDCPAPSSKSPPRSKKWYKPFGKFMNLKVIKKINNMSSTTPAVPPRSALRDLPTPKTDSRPEVMERGSSLYTLAMGPPLSKTPSLSSGSDGDVFDDATAHAQAGTPSHSMREKERGFFGKKEVSLERDPLRIRDGREAKESSTGVYTPPTFPGACGPRPSHFPSHVYTPPTFQLYPTPSTSDMSSAGPSRSSSLSSKEVNMPQTPVSPVSPTLRVFGSKTMAGLRRLSGQIAAYSPTQPSSSRDSYFSYTSTSSRQSSLGPITPNSAHFPAGLGVGLTEHDGITTGNYATTPTGMRSRAMSTIGSEDGTLTSQAVRRPSEAPKGKRKPVPEIVQLNDEVDGDADADADLNARMSQAQIGVTHAL